MQYFTQMTLTGVETADEAAIHRCLSDERHIAAAAWGIAKLGALARLSEAESNLLTQLGLVDPPSSPYMLADLIREGADPLGEAFARVRPAPERRLLGATYTPPEIVSSMVAWVAANHCPSRIVDPGTGSARFLLAAGSALPNASLVGVEIDPLPHSHRPGEPDGGRIRRPIPHPRG